MKLFDYMCKFNISKKTFASQLGINESTLYKYLNGENEPKLSIAMKIVELTISKVDYKDLTKETYVSPKTIYEVNPQFEKAEEEEESWEDML